MSGSIFAVFSAHKFHGPRGAGFIYWKQGRKLAPLMTGGGQEQNQRSGTENVPAIVAMAKALRLATEQKAEKPNHVHYKAICKKHWLGTKVTLFLAQKGLRRTYFVFH